MSLEVSESSIDQFINALRSLDGGTVASHAADGLSECIKATMIENKKSTLSIKFSIGKMAEDQVVMSAVVETKTPKPVIKTGFFVNQHYLPTRNRPDQGVLPFSK